MRRQWRNQLWQSLEEGAGKRYAECAAGANPKHWFTTSFEAAGKRCSECAAGANSKHWFTTSFEAAGKRCSECAAGAGSLSVTPPPPRPLVSAPSPAPPHRLPLLPHLSQLPLDRGVCGPEPRRCRNRVQLLLVCSLTLVAGTCNLALAVVLHVYY